jgi:hypothetical protein
MSESPLSLTETASALTYSLVTAAKGEPEMAFSGRNEEGDIQINDEILNHNAKIRQAWAAFANYSSSVNPICDNIMEMLQSAFELLNDKLEMNEEELNEFLNSQNLKDEELREIETDNWRASVFAFRKALTSMEYLSSSIQSERKDIMNSVWQVAHKEEVIEMI